MGEEVKDMERSSQRETRSFGAEVQQLLNIVVNSLYTDREIFVRELISNASDALEKLRYLKITQKNIADGELPLEIKIDLNKNEGTFVISDTGVGMTKEELIENLGTIAYSGSKKFVEHLVQGNERDVNLIGQFGVGFYSAFMVADRVEVYTRSYKQGEEGWIWSSCGAGTYTIEKAEGITRGTKVVLYLKEDAQEFADQNKIKEIIKKYSSFVPFPIFVNGERVNTIKALWTKNKNEITKEEYAEFYKYIANAYDDPLMTFHFTSDVPISISAILFVPEENFERFGLGRLEPGVNLYSQKILIQQKCEDILPKWLRFLKGVVDSEEIPLNISRESFQGSALAARLKKVITGRFLKFLKEQAEKDENKYSEFWKKFGSFIREGAATDGDFRDDLLELMRFQSSKLEPDKLTSLKDYVGRMKEEQKVIYYLNTPSRDMADSSPYMEAFRRQDLEVLYTDDAADDYIFNLIGDYKGKKIISIDQENLELPGPLGEKSKDEVFPKDEMEDFKKWLKGILGDKVSIIRESKRLVESPAVVLNPEGFTGGLQRAVQAINRELGMKSLKILEINFNHSLIKNLNILRNKDEQFAEKIAEQLFDNALLAAGFLVDTSTMVNRISEILEKAVTSIIID